MRTFQHIYSFSIPSLSWKRRCAIIGMLLFLLFDIMTFWKFDEFAALIHKRRFPSQSTRRNSPDLIEMLTPKNTGNLNLHLWSEICARDLNILCNFPMFPNAPDKRLLLNKTEVARNSTKRDPAGLSLRLFGFIVPDTSGLYLFTVKFCRSAEVWLSHNENWKNARKIWDTGKLSQEKKDSAVSDEIELMAGKQYFIEIVATCFGLRSKIQLLWKTPMSSSFEVINRTFLSQYTDDRDLNNSKIYDDLLPDSPACPSKRNKSTYFQVQREISYLSHDEVNDILPYCDYNASYTVNKRLESRHAIKFHLVHTYVYPFPEHSKLHAAKHLQLQDRSHAYKLPLAKDEAFEVVSIFLESLQREISG